MQYREGLILNITVFVVRVWRNIIERNLYEYNCVFVRVWRKSYRKELILNVTVFDVRV